jgi:hypothetical protein
MRATIGRLAGRVYRGTLNACGNSRESAFVSDMWCFNSVDLAR